MITNLLVVCNGNVYRSPIAEALFRDTLPDCEVRSAGLRAAVDFRPPDMLRAFFQAHQLARTNWTPWQIGRPDVARADLVLVMETAQKREVERSFPLATGRVFLLGESQGNDIADPHRGGLKMLERCYAQIEACVGAWARRIAAVNEGCVRG